MPLSPRDEWDLPKPVPIPARQVLAHFARTARNSQRPVFCVQIGANDGRINDPVHPYLSRDWNGLLIEPLPDVFENQLRRTYEGRPGIQLANVAVAPEAGSLPLFRLSISNARWATGLSSFRRENLEHHIANGYVARRAAEEGIDMPENTSDMIETVRVRTEPLDSIFARFGVQRVDVLCIDTEGYDFEILKMFDLERYQPEMIVFESRHLSPLDRASAMTTLHEQRYSIYEYDGDVAATRVPYPRGRQRIDLSIARLRALAGRLKRLAQQLIGRPADDGMMSTS